MLPFGPALRQPDRRSCGAASVVVARLVVDEASSVPSAASDFAAEVLATHRLLTSARDAAGRRQVPWPRALGTPPWAVARALGALTRRRFHTRPARWGRGSAYDLVIDALARGPVALYVGSRLLPRHVTLVLGADSDGDLRCYDPASGELITVTRAAFTGGHLRLGGWPVPWLVVVPQLSP